MKKLCVFVIIVAWMSTDVSWASYEWYTNPANGHHYALTLSHSNWADAEAEAVALGGHLVTVNDEAERDWLIDVNLNPFGDSYSREYHGVPKHNGIWVGLEYVEGDIHTRDSWQWINGEPITFWEVQPAFYTYTGIHMVMTGTYHPVGAGQFVNGPHHDYQPPYYLKGVIEVTTLILYVDTDAPGANDGSSWENAYIYLQDALADANSSPKPVEIRVAGGIYTPDSNSADPNGSGSREATFQLMNWVSLKGGYAGFGASDPNKRNTNCYETILSGDIDGNDVGEPTDPSRNENSYNVVTASHTDRTAIIEGFVITGGYGAGSGGGMYIDRGSPTITKCIFRKNRAYYAGAIAITKEPGTVGRSNPVMADCTFVENRAHTHGVMGFWHSDGFITNCSFKDNIANGGGASKIYASNVTITNCIFTNNEALGQGGGGIFFESHCTSLLQNCTFFGNTTNGSGGGIYNLNHTNTLTFQNCVLWNNHDIGGSDETAQVHNNPGAESMINYCCIQGWTGALGGIGNTGADPNFTDPNNGNYHLKSQAGHWDKSTHSWIKDNVTSPCIDAGNPMSLVGKEQFPNGGRVNMGAYGGTVKASKSYFGEPVCEDAIAGDVDGDCVVGFRDFAIMSFHWLEENKH